jgi:hypothetical protein
LRIYLFASCCPPPPPTPSMLVALIVFYPHLPTYSPVLGEASADLVTFLFYIIYLLHSCKVLTWPVDSHLLCTVPVLRIRIRCFLDPCIRDGSRIRDEQPKSLFWELRKSFFGLKILKFFDVDPDPGWKNSHPGSGINTPDPQHCSVRYIWM